MKLKKTLNLCIILFIIVACNENNKSINTAKYEIDIDTVKNDGIANISSYFKSVKPIILETNENNLLRSIDAIQVTDDFIFILDRFYKRLYCFNKNGKFIRTIGNLGSGPGDYTSISDFTIDNSNNIYILDKMSNKINLYSFSGEYVFTISLKNLEGSFGHIQVTDKFLYLDYQPNIISKKANSPLLLEIDKVSGNIIDKYLLASEYNFGFQLISFKEGSFFYSKNTNNPYFAPLYSSIIFSLNNYIQPYFQIKSNKLLNKEDFKGLDLSNPSLISEINRYDKIKSIMNFIEIKNFIICEFFAEYGMDIILFNKKSSKANLYDSFFDDYVYYTLNESIPHYFACSDEKGVYAYMNVDEVPLFVDYHNTGKVKIISNEQEDDYLKELTEESNPILFYYELK